ncbi:MAG: hypothetical protein JOZ19_16340 [Rubrobacter sp.]|nr:hypothetical protein [Rubrobacter sp.]
MSEDSSIAERLVAEEAADVEAQGEGDSLPGKVIEHPDIPGVSASGELGAQWASDAVVLAVSVMAFVSVETQTRCKVSGSGSIVGLA